MGDVPYDVGTQSGKARDSLAIKAFKLLYLLYYYLLNAIVQSILL